MEMKKRTGRSKSPKLTTKKRAKMKKSEFALPEGSMKNRKMGKSKPQYPVDTRGRAANAKARATQQYNKGNLTKSEEMKIDKKADEVLYGSNSEKQKMKMKKNKKNDERQKNERLL